MGYLSQLRHAASTGGDAIVCDGVRITHESLLSRVEAGCRSLHRAGIDSSATVGVTIADEVEHLVASLALLIVGARHVTLASHDSPTVRVDLAKKVGLTHALSIEPNPLSDGVANLTWPAVEHDASHTASFEPHAEGVVYLKTSGTTGDMNIVPFSETQLLAQARRHAEYGGERLLRLAAIEHNNSKRHRLYCVATGGTNVFRPRGDFDVARFCAANRVTCLDISRMHASDLAARGGNEALAKVKLRTGGSSIPVDVRRSIERGVTPLLYVRYAATECGAIAMAGPGEHDEDEPVGRPLPGVELQIVDADGHPVPAGNSGHIRLKAEGMATGYLGNQEATDRRFRDGWFWSGDMGLIRADGQLVVKGRADDMMILNGVNIFPVEIERVLERHPAVRVAAALPIASQVHGQIPVAAVELRDGHVVTAMELQSYAREHLALRAPRRIVIMAALPRNSQGKVVKREIALEFQPRASAP